MDQKDEWMEGRKKEGEEKDEGRERGRKKGRKGSFHRENLSDI